MLARVSPRSARGSAVRPRCRSTRPSARVEARATRARRAFRASTSGTRASARVETRHRARVEARATTVDLDFDARARPVEESAASALVAALAAGAWALASARLGPERSRLARFVVGAGVAALGRALTMRFFIERAHRDRGLSVREAADADGRFADVDGLAVHYKAVERAGSTRVVECMHGFGANVSSWTTSGAMSKLSEALNADVAAHDSCGFGLTERARDVKRYTRASDARACEAILRDIGAEGKSVTLIGHSLGAVSAALASAAGGVDHVVLVSPAILGGKLKPIDQRGGALSSASTASTIVRVRAGDAGDADVEPLSPDEAIHGDTPACARSQQRVLDARSPRRHSPVADRHDVR